MAEKRPALGRGLSALIPDAPAAAAAERALDVDIDLLRPNKFQPRTTIDDARLDELARSIRSNGIIQPIVVRRVGDGYEIVAGERRWRASQRAGLLKVPVVVRDIPDDRLLAAALIENIQREDLNPIEEAQAYRRLADDFHLTQEQIADVGRQGSIVDRELPAAAEAAARSAREAWRAGALSMGHARALAGFADEARSCALRADVIAKQLSVRETEALDPEEPPRRAAEKAEPPKDVHTRAAEEQLRFALGTRVRIVRKGKGGRIEIDFSVGRRAAAHSTSSLTEARRDDCDASVSEWNRTIQSRREDRRDMLKRLTSYSPAPVERASSPLVSSPRCWAICPCITTTGS